MMENQKRQKKYRQSEPSLLQDIFYLFLKIAAILVIFILIFTFLLGIFQCKEIGMKPAVKDGDLVIYYRLDKNYRISDVAVLEYEGKKQVRRVVAVGGDTVDITEQGLMVNGSIQEEQEIYTDTSQFQKGIDFPVTLKKGEVFLLGDNRASATDSRIYGPVEVKDTMGKVMTVLRRRGL